MGEKVMVLVPTAEHSLLAQWGEPYEVTERVSPVNYRIKKPDRRKKVQLSYQPAEEVPWQRECGFDGSGGQGKRGPDTGVPWPNSPAGYSLPSQGKQMSCFTISTPKICQEGAYQIPETRRVNAKNEVRVMLRMIEPYRVSGPVP